VLHGVWATVIILSVWTLHRHEPPSKGFALIYSLMVLSGAVLLAWYTVYSEILGWGPSWALVLTCAVEVLGIFLVFSGFLSSKETYSQPGRRR
jgi:hypothetical protein